jgi:hypothetical protein
MIIYSIKKMKFNSDWCLNASKEALTLSFMSLVGILVGICLILTTSNIMLAYSIALTTMLIAYLIVRIIDRGNR